jgi:hypothetical protein
MSNLQTYPTQLSSQVSQAELERIETVALLLDNLFHREEATARSILNCLYDVGSVRLIEQKVPLKALRWPLKGIARYSKPIFRLLALRWFKKNCPWMITDWLLVRLGWVASPHPSMAILIPRSLMYRPYFPPSYPHRKSLW